MKRFKRKLIYGIFYHRSTRKLYPKIHSIKISHKIYAHQKEMLMACLLHACLNDSSKHIVNSMDRILLDLHNDRRPFT